MFTIEHNIDRIIAGLGGIPGGIGRQMVTGFGHLGLELVAHIRGNLLSGQLLHVRTGQGRRSIFHRVEVDARSESIVLTVGADLAVAKYMRAQEHGAVITPKKARYLTIPVGDALTANGVPRFTARDLIANPESFGYESTFVTRNRTAIMGVINRGGGSFDDDSDHEAVPLFALRTSVYLQPVGYLSSALDSKGKGGVELLMNDIAKKGVDVIALDAGQMRESAMVLA